MDSNDTCRFCSSYEGHKEIANFKHKHPEFYGEVLFSEITVAIVVRSWRKGHKRNAGRTTDYRYHGIGYRLNFCPECGRKLR